MHNRPIPVIAIESPYNATVDLLLAALDDDNQVLLNRFLANETELEITKLIALYLDMVNGKKNLNQLLNDAINDSVLHGGLAVVLLLKMGVNIDQQSINTYLIRMANNLRASKSLGQRKQDLIIDMRGQYEIMLNLFSYLNARITKEEAYVALLEIDMNLDFTKPGFRTRGQEKQQAFAAYVASTNPAIPEVINDAINQLDWAIGSDSNITIEELCALQLRINGLKTLIENRAYPDNDQILLCSVINKRIDDRITHLQQQRQSFRAFTLCNLFAQSPSQPSSPPQALAAKQVEQDTQATLPIEILAEIAQYLPVR
jgi:hypothetical protein